MKNNTDLISVLHVGFIVEPSGGVLQQLEYERTLACDSDIPWTSVLFSRKRTKSPVSIGANNLLAKNKFLARLNYYFWLRKQLEKVDVLLLRYSLADPIQLLFLFLCKKPVYLVHHTIEEHQFKALPGITGLVKKFVERVIGPRCLARASGSVAVTNEIAQYEKSRVRSRPDYPVFIYPNGVLTENSPAAVDDGNGSDRDAPVNLLFVCSLFTSWHGLDLLLDSIDQSDSRFVLHLVGILYDTEKDRCEKDERIVVHGKLEMSQMKALEELSDIGVGSLALHRKSLNEACTLKVRQYLNAGLPVYSGHKDVFPDNFAYYTKGDANIEQIVEFADQMRDVSTAAVRNEAAPFIDKKQLWSDLYKQIVEDCNKRWPEVGSDACNLSRAQQLREKC